MKSKQTYKKPGKRVAHVLVVNNDEMARLTICQFLKKNNYQVSTVENGKQAVERIKQQVPDIILMDADMPGFEATRLIRQQLEDIPIFVITSYCDDVSVNRAFDAGATEYISKPIHWTILAKRLNNLWQSIQNSEMSRLASLMLENTRHGMIITDSNLIILALNSAFSHITGYSEDDALGQTPRLLSSGLNDITFYQKMWQSINELGYWEGEIWNKRKNGEIYPEQLNISAVKNRSGNVTHYIGSFTDISGIKEKEKRLQQHAHFDSLTGLANRLLFQERFEQAIVQAERNQQSVALLYIDLDNFKPVNDTYGHDVGDSVLKISALRLKKTIRSIDTISRLGGDEFAIILHNLKEIEDAGNVANKIIEIFSKVIIVNEIEIEVGCSIGISIYPDHNDQLDDLLKFADAAMYQAKQRGKNQVCFYSKKYHYQNPKIATA